MSITQPAAGRQNQSIEEYLAKVLTTVERLPPQTATLRDAYGCVAASDLPARIDLPAFASSAMDGYAVMSGDLASASPASPVRLPVAGEVRIGRAAGAAVAPGVAVAVPTGGLLPSGADAVVPIEECTPAPGGVVFTRPVPAGRNVRPVGEDLERGGIVVPAGRVLAAPDLAALAAGGYFEVEVVPQPVVAVLSTGDELVPPGANRGPGQIFESNSYLLEGMVRRAGGRPAYGGRVPDDPGAIREACARLAGSADLILCSGGVSAGRNDPVRRAFEAGGELDFVRVPAQPGRPQACGLVSGKPFLGLPGNPMAALVSSLLFAAPATGKLAGRRSQPEWVAATCRGEARASPSATRFVAAQLSRRGAEVFALPIPGRRSNQLAVLAGAAGLAEVPPGMPLVDGAPCRLLPIR